MLREKKVKVGERELTLRELSFMDHLELSDLGEIKWVDIYSRMMSPEDFEYLKDVGKSEAGVVREACAELREERKDYSPDAIKKGVTSGE